MGLNLRAYEHIEHVPDDQLTEDEYGDLVQHRVFVPHRAFAHGLDGMLGQDTPFSGSGLGGEYYNGWGEVAHADFSYADFSWVREAICRAFLGVPPRTLWGEPDAYRDAPFFDLLQFSDSEGTLGPLASRRLLDDFVEAGGDGVNRVLTHVHFDYREEAVVHYFALYQVFRVAADDGMVLFG